MNELKIVEPPKNSPTAVLIIKLFKSLIYFFYIVTVFFGGLSILLGYLALDKNILLGLLFIIVGFLLILHPYQIIMQPLFGSTLTDVNSANPRVRFFQSIFGLLFVLLFTFMTSDTKFLSNGFSIIFLIKLGALIYALTQAIMRWINLNRKN